VTVLPDGHVEVEAPKPDQPKAKYLLDLQLFGRLRVAVRAHRRVPVSVHAYALVGMLRHTLGLTRRLCEQESSWEVTDSKVVLQLRKLERGKWKSLQVHSQMKARPAPTRDPMSQLTASSIPVW
jgi:hypothetical protein